MNLVPAVASLFGLALPTAFTQPEARLSADLSIFYLYFFLTFVEHPDDDEAVLVAGGELLVRLVPAHHLDLPVVPLQRLVHRQVGGRCQTLHLPILSRFELPVDNKNEIFIFLTFDSF